MPWPTPGCDRLIDAMVTAEGGAAAFLRAVRITMPDCPSYEHARWIAANTIAHALWDDFLEGRDDATIAFVRFLGSRWAPAGVANDPTRLNEHWVPNVLAALRTSASVTA